MEVQQDAGNSLNGSAKWGDLCNPNEVPVHVPIVLEDKCEEREYSFRPNYTAKSVRAEPPTPTYIEIIPPQIIPDTPESDDIFSAPVLWIKKTFKIPEETLRDRILSAFTEAGVEAKITALYISRSQTKDHAYMILNSAKASELLLDGTINVVISIEDKDDDVVLWFDKADHLVPKGEQDPFTLYIFQLPKDRPAIQIGEELKRLISEWCPILKIEVSEGLDHQCSGWAKIYFKYEFDTQKCVYMLNYNRFMECEIRAAFCNSDKNYVRRAGEDKSRKSNPRLSPPNNSSDNDDDRPRHRNSNPRNGSGRGSGNRGSNQSNRYHNNQDDGDRPASGRGYNKSQVPKPKAVHHAVLATTVTTNSSNTPTIISAKQKNKEKGFQVVGAKKSPTNKSFSPANPKKKSSPVSASETELNSINVNPSTPAGDDWAPTRRETRKTVPTKESQTN